MGLLFLWLGLGLYIVLVMRLKTFTTSTMPEALRLIKTELGSDAIILSTKKIKRNGQNGLEITAAVDKPAPDLPVRHNKPLDLAAISAMPMHEDKVLSDQLKLHGIDGALVESIDKAQAGLAAAEFSAVEGVEMILNKRLDLMPLSKIFAVGRVHVFVGPTGVGKTTFVSKVAVWGKRGKQSVGLLSLDTHKVGGVEPLHVLADVLGETAHVINGADDVKNLGSKLGKRQLILVDTPGLNPYNTRALNRFKAELNALTSNPVVHLVLPASMNPQELKNAVAAFSRFKFQDILFTKLDETASLGSVVNVLAMNISGGAVSRSGDMADGPVALTAADLATELLKPPAHILREELDT